MSALPTAWVDSSTYRDAAGDWLTVKAAAAKYRLPFRSLHRWADPKYGCRFLDGGRCISSVQAPAPEPGRHPTILVLLVSDLAAVQAAYSTRQRRVPSASASPDYRDARGDFFTSARLSKRLNVGRLQIQRWARRPSRLRPGEMAVRSETIAAADGRGPVTRAVYLEADALACVQGKEAVSRGHASRVIHRGEKKEGDWQAALRKKAAAFLREALASRGPLRPEEIMRLAREAGVSRPRLFSVREGAGVLIRWQGPVDGAQWHEEPGKGRRSFWCLPGQKLATAGAAAEESPSNPTAPTDPNASAVKAKRRRGQRGKGKNTAERHAEIICEWETGEYASRGELARALGVDRSTVRKVLNAAAGGEKRSPA